MSVKNLYYYFSGALSPEICDNIIKAGETKLNLLKSAGANTSGTTGGAREKQALKSSKAVSQADKTAMELEDPENSYIRDCEVSWLEDKWIYDTIWPYVVEANEKARWKYDVDWGESLQFTKYPSPGGFYGWHNDSNSDHYSKYKKAIPGITPIKENGNYIDNHTPNNNFFGKVRKLSVTINLTKPEDYEGGNLKFDYGPHVKRDNQFHECTEIRPRGSVIVFPSYVYHQVTPVTKGTRYSLVMWCLGRPLK